MIEKNTMIIYPEIKTAMGMLMRTFFFKAASAAGISFGTQILRP